MPKLIISNDGLVFKEVQLTKDRTSVGRRPYNDVVVDSLAVSGEHAALQMSDQKVYIEDLHSTNGTFVNGKAIKKQLLHHNDTVEIGKFKIKYVSEMGAVDTTPAPASSAAPAPPAALIRVMSGVATGREVVLVKAVTTLGKPGVAVASITKRPQGFVVTHVEGASASLLNGTPLGAEPVMLKNGDTLELAGTKIQFVQT